MPTKDKPDLLDPLFTALENYGNREGTESQMGKTGDFLRLAFSWIPASRRKHFLRANQVTSFIKREGGDDES